MLSLRWGSNPQCLGFEATEHLRNRMRNENCRKTSLKRLQLTMGAVHKHSCRFKLVLPRHTFDPSHRSYTSRINDWRRYILRHTGTLALIHCVKEQYVGYTHIEIYLNRGIRSEFHGTSVELKTYRG